MNDNQRAERRASILDAAARCKVKAEGGYVLASQVAAEAGVSTRTINRYFPDYDTMIYEAAARYLRNRFKNIVNAYKLLDMKGLNGRQRLIAFMNMLVNSYEKDISATIVYIEANIRCISIGMDKKFEKLNLGNEISNIIVGNISDGVNDGSIINTIEPKKAMLMISANFNGLMQRLLYISRSNDTDYTIKDIFALMREYIVMIDMYLKP